MSAKDTVAKEYLQVNERFADLFNYYLFDGEQIIKPADLEERDSTEVLSVYGTNKTEKQVQKWRDLLKNAIIKYSNETYFVLLGVENQSDIHYAMPVKNAIYDALNYGTQVNEAARKHRKDNDFDEAAEFLSGFKTTDKLTPVITLTVYWGPDEWTAPRTLHEMINVPDKRMLEYISNYKINLIEPCKITDFNKFYTSVGKVFEIIKASTSKKQMEQIFYSNTEYRHLENDAVSAINVFTGINVVLNEKEGVTDMCKAWEDQLNDGIIKGREEGREEGRQEERIKMISKFIDNQDVLEKMEATDEEIMEAKKLLQLA